MFTARSIVLKLWGEDGLTRFVWAMRVRRLEAARRGQGRRPALPSPARQTANANWPSSSGYCVSLADRSQRLCPCQCAGRLGQLHPSPPGSGRKRRAARNEQHRLPRRSDEMASTARGLEASGYLLSRGGWELLHVPARCGWQGGEGFVNGAAERYVIVQAGDAEQLPDLVPVAGHAQSTPVSGRPAGGQGEHTQPGGSDEGDLVEVDDEGAAAGRQGGQVFAQLAAVLMSMSPDTVTSMRPSSCCTRIVSASSMAVNRPSPRRGTPDRLLTVGRGPAVARMWCSVARLQSPSGHHARPACQVKRPCGCDGDA